jgi:SAM-dependent methyltransferase
MDDIIAKAHIERLLLENLDGIRTAFDGGAGYGRFSLLLAAKGVHVTHFDISLPMIETAKKLAETRGVAANMTFIHGSLEDLTAFRDGQFDLVMSFDAPISYTYPNHESVVKNLIRIADKRICLSVYSRLSWTYHFDPAQKEKYILDAAADDSLARWTLDHGLPLRAEHRPDMTAVREFSKTGLMEPVDKTAEAFEHGGAPWPVSYAFMPGELRGILERHGAKDIRLSGPGALSRSIPGEVLRNIMRNEALKRDFLEYCYEYDSNPHVAGMGKDNIAVMAAL